ncbi:hypothetical protein ACHAXR_007230, partial [Thalassiosira sp. AJA248-18]
MLSCEQNPTSGDIIVNGRSVTSDRRAVSKMIGECKQDDFLWPNLTAREHLELFAGIRGVSKEEMPKTVQKWLESVDLDKVQHIRAGTFSGGMKRRLSLAISTIGDAPIIVLDEPTTGMDPVSRRFVWNHISEVKTGRVILLTTHAMEEADLLSDNVAIMAHGTLNAYGSPLELKTKYGSALQFSIISEKEHATVVEEEVNNVFADSLSYIEYDGGDSGYSTLTIKKVCKGLGGSRGVSPVAPAVAVPVLQGKSPETPVALASRVNADEGVPVAALSEFIGWLESENSPVSEFGISNSSLEEVFLAVTHNAGPASAAQHANQYHGCCCRKRKPQTHHAVENGNIESITPVPTPAQNVNQLPKVNISSYSRNLSVITQTAAIVRFFFARSWTGRPSIMNWIIFSVFCVANMMNGFGMAVVWPDINFSYLLLATVSALSFMLIIIISPIYSDRVNGNFKRMSTQSMMGQSFLLGTSLYSLMVQFVYSFVALTLFFGSNVFRTASTPDCESDTASSSTSTDDYYSYHDCAYAKFGDKPVVPPFNRISVTEGLTGTSDENEGFLYAHSASGGYGMVFGIIVIFSLTLSSAFLPGFKLSLVGVSLVLLASCASPGLLHLSYALDESFLGNCTEQIESHHNCSESLFTFDNVTGDFVDCVGWFITNPLIYCTPAYAGILPQLGLFQTLALTLMSDIVFYSEPKEYAEEFVTKLVEGGAKCAGNRCNFEYARQLYGENLGYMFLGALLLLVLGV